MASSSVQAKAPAPPYFDEGASKANALLQALAPCQVDCILLGDSLAEAWPVVMWEPRRVIRLGVGGDRIENVTWRLLASDHASIITPHVVLVAGVNNLWSGDDGGTSFATLKVLLSLIARTWPDARTTVMAVPPFGAKLSGPEQQRRIYNDAIAQDQNINFIDLDDIFRDDRDHFCDDHIHFNDAGYHALTNYLKSQLDVIST